MTDTWDGRPQNPERDGWHWLQFNDDRPIPTAWIAEIDAWASGAAYSPEGVVELGFRYLAPCLTPAEVEARVAAARREGIEAAAEIAKQFAIHQGDAYDIVAAIRTKLLPEDDR